MLGQRRRRWPNIKPTLGQRLVLPRKQILPFGFAGQQTPGKLNSLHPSCAASKLDCNRYPAEIEYEIRRGGRLLIDSLDVGPPAMERRAQDPHSPGRGSSLY